MIKKTENCMYCGEKMKSITAKKKFCCDLHRVYWNRMRKAADKLGEAVIPTKSIQDLTKPTNNLGLVEMPKTNYVVNTEKIAELEKELEAIPDKTKGLGKKRAEFIESKIYKLKYNQ